MRKIFTAMKTDFEQMCERDSDRIQTLESEVNSLNNKIKKLDEKADETEANSRRDIIILSGDDIPACASTKNCNKVVYDTTKTKLKVTINHRDILVGHRLGAHK